MMLLKLFNELSLHPKNATELKGLITNLAIDGKLTQAKKPEVKSLGEIIQFTKNGFTGRPNDEKYGIKRLGIETVTQSAFLEVNEGLAKYIEIDEKKKENYFAKDKDVFICRQNGNLRFVGKAAVYYGEDDKLIFSDSLIQVRPNSVLIDSSFLVVFINSEKARHQIEKFCATTAGNFSINGTNLKKIIIPLYGIKEQHAIVTFVNQLFAEVEQLEQLTKERIQLKHDFAASALQRLVQAGNINGEWQTVQQHFHPFFNEKANVKKLRETILQLAVQGKLTTRWRAENTDTEPANELLKRIAAKKQQLIQSGKIKKEKPLPPIKEEEIPFELPEGWVWCRLGELIVFLNGFAFKSNTYVPNSKFQVIRLGNVKNDNFLLNNKKAFVSEHIGQAAKEHQLEKLDILTTLTGTKGKRDYCYTCLVKAEHLEDKVLLLNQRVGCIRSIDKNLTEVINMFLKTESILFQLFATETGTANQGNIGSTAYKNLVFPLPPYQEQHTIVTTVNTLMGLCDTLEQEIDQQQSQVEELMRSCLREVLEGGD